MVKINNMLKSAVADTGEVDMVKDTGEKKKDAGGWTSLVVQRLSICLLMQEIWAQSWSGEIPHAAGQLSPRATTAEPVCCS